MAPVKLEGPTLGHKHRNYNKIVEESTANQTTVLQDVDLNVDDASNLVKIDIASAKRNVDYILGILKGNDMLYVSRALTRSPWLITDNTYGHIINPEYLHSHLIPNMMAKAANKLMLHIRLNLRDEKRVEDFFNYYELLDLKTALKWLPHCSAAFMEIKVEKYSNNINPHLLKRLCEKYHCILKVYVNVTQTNWGYARMGFQATMFLLNTHMNFYLDVIETREGYEFPKFNAKCTKLLLRKCPERIHKNFFKYADNIHIPTFASFLDENKVREFLITQANMHPKNNWINFEKVQYFVKRMPLEERISFIQDMLVHKCPNQDNEIVDSEPSTPSCDDMDVDDTKMDENSGMMHLYKYIRNNSWNYNDTLNLLNWYKCLPFDVVLAEFREKIKNITDDHEKNCMFKRLTELVDQDSRYLESLLQYYNDTHLKNSEYNTVNFVHNLFERPTNVLKYNSKCWSLLMNIFKAINFNIQKLDGYHSINHDQIMLKAIILHEVINKKEVPEKVSDRFDFDTFKGFQKKMNLQEQTLLFDYLYNCLLKIIEKEDKNLANFETFHKIVKLTKLMLTLFNDWQKNLADYPYVLNKIKDLIEAKCNSHKTYGLSWIYNVNKSWRKCLFEESILLCESDRVCVNALKHDPGLLSRHEKVVASMRCNDAVSMRQFLIKLKIYWADSLASEWSQSYRERLTQPLGHKALVKGLCFLLPEKELSVIINEYKPEDPNINWEKNDEVLISLRKNIAKNMHFSRPQPTPDAILQYAKGDYLQFALPSLNAILFNLCLVSSGEVIPKLLNSPVSLQKHGIRCAFAKMQSEDLQRIFSHHWKTIKNLSLRAVMFKLTYELLCKEKDPVKIENIWGLLTVFIDALTLEEDKTIYELLGKAKKVPLSVRPAFVKTSYKFLKNLLPKSDLEKNKYEQSLNVLICDMESIIDLMEPEFITEVIQEYFVAVYTTEKSDGFVPKDVMPLLASFLCCSESIDIQAQRYELVLMPLLRHAVNVWASKDKDDIAKTNLKRLLKILRKKLKSLVVKNGVVPVAMFGDIQKELEQSLDKNVAYLTLREWKLTVAFAKVVNDNKVRVERSIYKDDEDYWTAICNDSAPQFGKLCLDFLKQDIKSFFPSIDEYFTKALIVVFKDIIDDNIQLEVLKNILTEELIQSYLVAIRILPTYYGHCDGPILDFHKTILSHPSLEVKMHFYHKYKSYRHKNLILA